MKTCPQCGNQVDDNVKFCNKCGAKVDAPAAAPQAAPAQQAAPAPMSPQQPYNQQYQQYNAAPPAPAITDHTAEFDPKDISDNKVIAMCAYIYGIFGVIVALLASKESPYAAFHTRQALKLEVVTMLLIICCCIPLVNFIAVFVAGIWAIISVVLKIIAFFNVAGGKAKEVPIVSSFGFLK